MITLGFIFTPQDEERMEETKKAAARYMLTFGKGRAANSVLIRQRHERLAD